ncbi:MAG: colicin transporter [Sphingobium sp.]
MIAVKRLQSLFWVLLVAFGALSAYLVSLKVATERNELNRVRSQIASARGDIRYLETEFSARANMRQLERWNADDFRYSTPTSEHYLAGERALAHLDGLQSNGPAYVAPPVMVAMVETPQDLPSAVNVSGSSPASSQIRSDVAVIRTAQITDDRQRGRKGTGNDSAGGIAFASAATPNAHMRIPISSPRSPAPMAGSLARTTERMAMLDARLLDDGTLGDIGRRAAAEKRRGND